MSYSKNQPVEKSDLPTQSVHYQRVTILKINWRFRKCSGWFRDIERTSTFAKTFPKTTSFLVVAHRPIKKLQIRVC